MLQAGDLRLPWTLPTWPGLDQLDKIKQQNIKWKKTNNTQNQNKYYSSWRS